MVYFQPFRSGFGVNPLYGFKVRPRRDRLFLLGASTCSICVIDFLTFLLNSTNPKINFILIPLTIS